MQRPTLQNLHIIYFTRLHDSNLAGNKKSASIHHSLSLISSRVSVVNSSRLFVPYRASSGNVLQSISLLFLCVDIIGSMLCAVGCIVKSLIKYKSGKFLFVFYNLMPDTSLPGISIILITSMIPFIHIRTLLEIEENIITDSVASLWRLYYKLIADIFSFDYLLSVTSFSAVGIKCLSLPMVFPGIYNFCENNSLKELVPNRLSTIKYFLFASRIDDQRGLFEFLEILDNFSPDQIHELNSSNVRFIVCGYGAPCNQALARNKINKINSKFTFDYLIIDGIGCPKQVYDNYFLDSLCCISIVNNPDFAASSFPSKIFDALCHCKIILSFGNVDFSSFDTLSHILSCPSINSYNLFNFLKYISSNYKELYHQSNLYATICRDKFSSIALSGELLNRLDQCI